MASFQEQSDTFMSWLRAQAGVRISPRITLTDLREQGSGRGVVATKDLDVGEELFFIPHDTVLSVFTSDLATYVPEIRQMERTDAWKALILTMIYEDGKGEHSKWYTYFNIFPESLNTLLYWSDDELAELKGSAVLSKTNQKEVDELVDDVFLPFVSKHAKHYGIHAEAFRSSNARDRLAPLVKRMGTLIMAYGFDIERPENEEDINQDGYVSEDEDNLSKGMVPMADMLNADGVQKNNARLEHDDDGLQMVAIKSIKQGEECFNDYGPCPRSDLLRRYGYVSDEYKKHDVVEISLETIVKAISEKTGMSAEELMSRSEGDCRGTRKPLAKLLQNSTGSEWCIFMDDAYDVPSINQDFCFFDPGLVLSVQVLAADEKEVKVLGKLKRCPLDVFDRKTAGLLNAIMEKRLKDYPTTIAQDHKLLEDKPIPPRLRQAIQVRLGEKEILASAVSEDAEGDLMAQTAKGYEERETKRQKRPERFD